MERESNKQQQQKQPWSYTSCGFMASSTSSFTWPPRSYPCPCSFCKREFRSAQALGGHMNVHRRDRARLRHGFPPLPPPPPVACRSSRAPAAAVIPNLNYPPPPPPQYDHRHRPATSTSIAEVSLQLGVGVVRSCSTTATPITPGGGLDLELRLGVS